MASALIRHLESSVKQHRIPVNSSSDSVCSPTNPAVSEKLFMQWFNWTYEFSDGTRLVGQVMAELNEAGDRLLNPIAIHVDYLAFDGETVLASWHDPDFACFDATVDGTSLLIVASNDNFVGNSMCLVFSRTRSRAQVTDREIQWVGEPFDPNAWSLTPIFNTVSQTFSPASSVSPKLDVTVDVVFSPFFPFYAVNFRINKPRVEKRYRWTFAPYFSVFPLLRVS